MKKSKILKSIISLSTCLVLVDSIPLTSTSCRSSQKSLDKITSVEEMRNFDPLNYGVKKIDEVNYTIPPYTNTEDDEKMLDDFANKVKDDSNYFKFIFLMYNFSSLFDAIFDHSGSPKDTWTNIFSSKYFNKISYELKEFTFEWIQNPLTKKIDLIMNGHSHFWAEGKFKTVDGIYNYFSLDLIMNSEKLTPFHFLNLIQTNRDEFKISHISQLFSSENNDNFINLKYEFVDYSSQLEPIVEEGKSSTILSSYNLPYTSTGFISDVVFVYSDQ